MLPWGRQQIPKAGVGKGCWHGCCRAFRTSTGALQAVRGAQHSSSKLAYVQASRSASRRASSCSYLAALVALPTKSPAALIFQNFRRLQGRLGWSAAGAQHPQTLTRTDRAAVTLSTCSMASSLTSAQLPAVLRGWVRAHRWLSVLTALLLWTPPLRQCRDRRRARVGARVLRGGGQG
jgi:hypothetical protein